jgi:hypothetical protein
MELDTVAGLCLLVYVPLLLAGAVMYGPLGRAVSSGATGDVALARIAETGRRFAIVNAIFHLGPVLILPALIALFNNLSPYRPTEVAIGTLIGAVCFAVPIAVTFTLSMGLNRLATLYATADSDRRALLAAAADANLGTQQGAEFVQTGIAGLWPLSIAWAMFAAPGWPTWLAALGLIAGAGMSAAGLASIFVAWPRVGRIFAVAGGIGLFALAIWFVGVGWHLAT